MRCTIDGVLRGILPEGTPVFRGMKAGDVDPGASRKVLHHRLGQGPVGGGVLRRCCTCIISTPKQENNGYLIN